MDLAARAEELGVTPDELRAYLKSERHRLSKAKAIRESRLERGKVQEKKKCERKKCPNEFIATHQNQKFCSQQCVDKDYYERKGKALRQQKLREQQLQDLVGY